MANRTKFYFTIKLLNRDTGINKQVRIASYSYVEAQLTLLNDLCKQNDSLEWCIMGVKDKIHKASDDRKKEAARKKRYKAQMKNARKGNYYLS